MRSLQRLKNSTAWNMPKYELFLIRIFPYMDKIVSVFLRIWTEFPILCNYRKIRIKEFLYYVIFHAVLNFICYGSPGNAFAVSTSRFFQKLTER